MLKTLFFLSMNINNELQAFWTGIMEITENDTHIYKCFFDC